MMMKKRIAVTLSPGPHIEHTVGLLRLGAGQWHLRRLVFRCR